MSVSNFGNSVYRKFRFFAWRKLHIKFVNNHSLKIKIELKDWNQIKIDLRKLWQRVIFLFNRCYIPTYWILELDKKLHASLVSIPYGSLNLYSMQLLTSVQQNQSRINIIFQFGVPIARINKILILVIALIRKTLFYIFYITKKFP